MRAWIGVRSDRGNRIGEATAIRPATSQPVRIRYASEPRATTTSALFIDGKDTDRAFYAEELRSTSPDYHIVEATDGQSGFDLYLSQRIDCVVTELALPD
jgi:hypothetical protein